MGIINAVYTYLERAGSGNEIDNGNQALRLPRDGLLCISQSKHWLDCQRWLCPLMYCHKHSWVVRRILFFFLTGSLAGSISLSLRFPAQKYSVDAGLF